jgi:hypothetical protein
MNNTVEFVKTSTQEVVSIRAADHGDSTYALTVAPIGTDIINRVQKVGEVNFASDLRTADGILISGPGVLSRLIVANNHATDPLTVSIFDNTVTGGRNLTPDFTVGPRQVVSLSPDTPFALGIFVDFGTTGTPSAMAYAKQVQ